MSNPVAVVTGGSRGIGREIVLELARRGTDVVINYAGNEAKALEVLAEVKRYGVQALAVQANVGVLTEADALIARTVEQFGKIDILVNNAGITKDNLLIRMKEEEWNSVIETNLKGVFACTRAAARPMMKARYGRIINITSVVGILGNPGQANYVAAKAGVIGLTKSTARELASRGITVNAIAPGYIETDMTVQLGEDVKVKLLDQIPLARLGKPADVAAVVAFLASDQSSYITGQVLSVDGGMAM
ncbi:MAG: beta-ketoacyl-ACP reductase [Bacilli bacterium]|nr:beta-ketoacyl-ACP reductase [Bacilli bacterium]